MVSDFRTPRAGEAPQPSFISFNIRLIPVAVLPDSPHPKKNRFCRLLGFRVPKCPQHIPDCFIKRPSAKQIAHIYSESRRVFREDPQQPLPFSDYAK